MTTTSTFWNTLADSLIKQEGVDAGDKVAVAHLAGRVMRGEVVTDLYAGPEQAAAVAGVLQSRAA